MRLDITHEITLAATGQAPSAFRILTAGRNDCTTAGIVLFDDDAASAVLAAHAAQGVDLAIDYDHAMALDGTPVADRAAAGWFRPGVRAGELWAEDVRWTPRGRAAVESREWRYTSLWGQVDKASKRLVRLMNVALVNRPATRGTLPLVASEVAPSPTLPPIAPELAGELAAHGMSAADYHAYRAYQDQRDAEDAMADGAARRLEAQMNALGGGR